MHVCPSVCVCVCVCLCVPVSLCLRVHLVTSTPACDNFGASPTDAAGTAPGASLQPMRTCCACHCSQNLHNSLHKAYIGACQVGTCSGAQHQPPPCPSADRRSRSARWPPHPPRPQSSKFITSSPFSNKLTLLVQNIQTATSERPTWRPACSSTARTWSSCAGA